MHAEKEQANTTKLSSSCPGVLCAAGSSATRHVINANQDRAERCDVCGRWFRSRGDLAVHGEEGAGGQDSSIDVTTMASAGCNRCTLKPDSNTGVQCSECGRRFRRPGDMKRHKCVAVRARPVKEQRGAVQCSLCKGGH